MRYYSVGSMENNSARRNLCDNCEKNWEIRVLLELNERGNFEI